MTGSTSLELYPGDLPASLPVFPLSGVMLLPRGRLPLNVFEPRYLNMTLDALMTKPRLIGMIQPTEPENRNPEPPLYRVGCAGRITAFSETDDGRILITLSGISRFRIAAELASVRGYRMVQADWSEFAHDFLLDEPSETAGEIDRPRLVQGLREYFKLHGIDINWDAVEQTPNDRLVTSLSMICPFEPSEKQALLEAPDLVERARTMTALVEMALLDSSDSEVARH